MDIFISYRRKVGSSDNLSAELVNEKLNSLGIETFFDKHSIDGKHSEDFWKRIKDGIDRSPNFLMIYTKGYLEKRNDEEDFVIKEIDYARQQGKKIIAIAFDDIDLNDPNSISHADDYSWIKKLNFQKYSSDYPNESIKKIIDSMVDSKGKQFSLKKELSNNSWYSKYGMNEEDMLWIKTDSDVCKDLDWEVLNKAIVDAGNFSEDSELSLFTYKAYDIETYAKKYSLGYNRKSKIKAPVIKNVYGVTYDWLLDDASKIFGEGHFIADDFPTEDYICKIQDILDANGLPYFDIMDLTLVIKDVNKPEKLVYDITKYLNPNGGILYIREMDDDYVDAYPFYDEIRKLCDFLELDDGAGNRHTGKKIYNYLNKAGADKVYISDKVISTANQNTDYRVKLCQTYFSFLNPELRALAEVNDENINKSNYEKYKDAYEWMEENYERVESVFRLKEFYFRAGFIAGYGIFRKEIKEQEDYFVFNK